MRWSMRRDLTTRSIILEMRDRFEIGRQFESSSLSNVGFLSSGEITDVWANCYAAGWEWESASVIGFSGIICRRRKTTDSSLVMFLLMFCQLWTDSESLNCEQSHFLSLACGTVWAIGLGFLLRALHFSSAPSFLQLQLWPNQIRSCESFMSRTWT